MTQALRLGIAGLGTVGAGVLDILARHKELVAARAGRPVEVVAVSARSRGKDRGHDLSKLAWHDDPVKLAADPSVDVFVELMGGEGDPAKAAVETAIRSAKHVITANKALLAHHGSALARLAEEKGVALNFEASVAGGIPIIKTIREGLAGNRVGKLFGIMNGTCNYILTKMGNEGRSFTEVLKEAQALGYAEADPTFDVEGVDAAHKATIMSAIAFGIPMQFDKAYIEGISKLDSVDITYAEQLGYRIKLLGIARRRENGVELRVHPTLIPAKRLIANVEGAMNAVLVQGDAVGATLYYGKGAGAEPTASAVIADLVDVTRLHTSDPEHRVPHLAFQPDQVRNVPVLPIEDVVTSYYLRMRVEDKPGVLADITRILADSDISIEALNQKEAAEGESHTDIILLTHQTVERKANAAIARIEALPVVHGKVTKLRMESL